MCDLTTSTIGDLCYVTDGAHAKVERQLQGVMYLTSKNIGVGNVVLDRVDYISELDYERLFSDTSKAQRRLRPGDVLVGIIGTFGNAYLYKDEDRFGVSSAVALLRPDPAQLDSRFLYYVVTSPTFRAAHNAYKAGSVQGYTNIPTIKRLPVPTPPLPEQHRIAHILGTLDDKIELNRRMNRTLEAITRAIFKSWFIDFDPVHAKAEGRDPVGMDPETAALFPDSFQPACAASVAAGRDSPLGKIPKGWEVKPFSEIIEINPSRRLKKGSLAPYVDMASLPTSGSQLQASPATREYKSGSRFQNRDVLFARITPCLENGKTVLVDFLERGMVGAGSTEFLVFGPRLPGTYFAYCASRWGELRDHAIASMTGTSGRQRAQKEAFDHFEMAVPNDEVLKTFETRAAPLFAAQRSNSIESRGLSTIRDTLLPRLLSGGLSPAKQKEQS